MGIRLKIFVGKCTKEFAKESLPEKSKGICKKRRGEGGEGVDKILSTFLKVFSQAAISYGYFPKWQLPKREFSQAVAALEKYPTSIICLLSLHLKKKKNIGHF